VSGRGAGLPPGAARPWPAPVTSPLSPTEGAHNCRPLGVGVGIAAAAPAHGARSDHHRGCRAGPLKPLPSAAARARRALLDSLRNDLGSAREHQALAESLAASRGTQLEELKVRARGGWEGRGRGGDAGRCGGFRSGPWGC
jgi:hypothetical protein